MESEKEESKERITREGTNRKKKEGNEREWNDQARRKRGEEKERCWSGRMEKTRVERRKGKRKQGGMRMGRDAKSENQTLKLLETISRETVGM